LKVYIAVIDTLIKGVMFDRISSRSRGTDLEMKWLTMMTNVIFVADSTTLFIL